MSYAQYTGDGHRNYVGIAVVAVLHIALIYALANGLGRKLVDVIKKPLDVAIIEEVKIAPPPPPPPPQQVRQTPPPTFTPPPPAYVPPPEVPVHAAPVENVVTATVQTPPPPPVVAAPPTPPSVVEPARPRELAAAVACPGYENVKGRLAALAEKQSWSGDILVEFLVGAGGEVSNVVVARSSNRIFNNAVVAAVSKIQCTDQPRPVKVLVPLSFRLE